MPPIQIQEPGQSTALPPSAMGIDLGTTHCVVALAHRAAPDTPPRVEILPLFGGSKQSTSNPTLLHSVLGFSESGTLLCGHEALAQATPPLASSLKRLMGQAPGSPAAHSFPMDVAACPTRGLVVCLDQKTAQPLAQRKTLSPIEGAEALLAHIKRLAEAHAGHTLDQAVITVPAYFDERARDATRLAAEAAGLKVLRLLSEPTAAALAYGLDQGASGLYGVYDLGGGTFDFSLLRLTRGAFQVIATTGHCFLGGDDIDHAICTHLASEAFQNATPPEKASALGAARRAKEELSDVSETRLALLGQSYTLSRTQLEALAAPLLETTQKLTQALLAEQKIAPDTLDGLVLVGGATRMPKVRQMWGQLLGKPPLTHLHPDHAVAMGAALQAEALTYGAQHLLLDVTPLTLGIEVMGQLVEPLIPRNSRIPASATQTFTTAVPNQTKLLIHVVQGEAETIKDCRSLAQFQLSGIPKLPQGEARIDVTFTLDTDGLLNVKAREHTTGTEQHVAIKPAHDLDEEAALGLLRAGVR